MRDSGYDIEPDNWYVEPAWCVGALLKRETFTGRILDPSCGEGNIPKTCRLHRLQCDGSDLRDRGYGTPNVDFFSIRETVPNIITNPPFDNIQRYIDHALNITTHKVAIMARLALLESMERQAWWQQVPLKKMWTSSKRLSMPPGGKGIKAKGGTIPFAWFVFEKGYTGEPTIGWF